MLYEVITKTLQGNYVAGVYYPDKTRVGWWKNGYPEYFAKVLNAPNWVGIDVQIDGLELDLNTCFTHNFRRTLHMKEGYLLREFDATIKDGKTIRVRAFRFISLANTENGIIKYEVTPLDFSGEIRFTPYIDGDVKNEDSNYKEQFWNILETEVNNESAYLESQTKKLDFRCGFAMCHQITLNGKAIQPETQHLKQAKWVGKHILVSVNKGETLALEKYVAVTSTLNHTAENLKEVSLTSAKNAATLGFDVLFEAHKTLSIDRNNALSLGGTRGATREGRVMTTPVWVLLRNNFV